MEFVKFPSIDQFRHAVRSIQSSAKFAGLDQDGNPTFHKNPEYPVVTFEGTVKLHGTNAGVCYDDSTGELWAQSRKNIITPEKDNAGFAFFVHSNKDKFLQMFREIAAWFPNSTITIFGEWCGGNIQKGVALTGLERMFVIFDMKVDGEWADSIDNIPTDPLWNVYRITEFPTYSMKIDFNQPELSVNSLTELTELVEKECPVGKFFGVSGVGEGIVWKARYKDDVHRFKVKGEKHSSSKVKKLAKVDPEKLKSIQEFVDYAVTENRLTQGVDEVFTTTNREPDIRQVGEFIKWVSNDVFKEELDTLANSGLEPKDVVKSVNASALKWFKTKFNF